MGPAGPQGQTGPQGETGATGAQGPAGLSGYEVISTTLPLDTSTSSADPDGGLLIWHHGTVSCPAGKSIISASHTLGGNLGEKLRMSDWANLVQWGTRLQNAPDGTGSYTVLVINPLEITLTADVTMVCANVAN